MAVNGFSIVFLLGIIAAAQGLTISTVLSHADQMRMKKIFNSSPYKDLETAYYSTLGTNALHGEIEDAVVMCKFVNSQVDSKNLKSLFLASSISSSIEKCTLKVSNAEEFLNDAIKTEASTETLRYAVGALSNLGLKVDSKAVAESLKAAIQSDTEEGLKSTSNALDVALLLQGQDLGFIFDSIEDAVAQADEIDGKFLQFEGGVSLTSQFINAAYKLGKVMKKAPVITSDQAVKFANYLLSRKFVQSHKDAYFVVLGLSTYANNEFHIPVVVQPHGPSVISQDNKLFKVRVTNVLDEAFGKMTVTGVTATDSDGTSVLSNKLFTESPEEFIVLKTELGRSYFACHSYQLDVMSVKPEPGTYTITISIKPVKEDKRLLGLSDAELQLKVVTKVTIQDVDVSVIDKEQGIKSKSTSVQYPKSFDGVLDADFHQKLQMKFSLTDKNSGEKMTAHQTFVRLTNKKTNQEVFFVAELEAGSNKVYKFDLDIAAAAKDSFNSLSGKYQMDLIVGDALIQNPFVWNVGSISLKFAEESAKPKQDKDKLFHAQPEIQHMFRVPEKRPPSAVSTAFTVLIILPLVVMVIVWIQLGANCSNFEFSLGSIVFHLGLGAILCLYLMFWLKLDMFCTLKALAVLGTITFLGGNSLLGQIAARRKEKP